MPELEELEPLDPHQHDEDCDCLDNPNNSHYFDSRAVTFRQLESYYRAQQYALMMAPPKNPGVP